MIGAHSPIGIPQSADSQLAVGITAGGTKISDLPEALAWQVVREHYLRDDIHSGTPLDPSCPAESHKLSKSAVHYLVIDTNIALQQVS